MRLNGQASVKSNDGDAHYALETHKTGDNGADGRVTSVTAQVH